MPSLSLFLSDFVLLIYLVDLILIVAMLFWERNDPRSTLLWIALMVFVPIVGFFLYLFFGETFYSQRTFRKKSAEDKVIEDAVSWANTVMDTEAEDHPESIEKIRFAKTLNAAGGGIYTNNNYVTYLPKGEEYFKRLLEDLGNAKESINFEYYIVRNDEISNQLMDILIERADHGIKVRLMIDALGNNKGPKRKMKKLMAAGGKCALFHSVWTCLLSPRKNNRNHRKIAIIDGTVAYVGGYNIGDEYLGKGPFGYWRDCAVRLEGEAVNSVQFRFLVDWRYATKEDLTSDLNFYRREDNPGNTTVQLISGGPDVRGLNPVLIQYLNIISHSKRTIYIHTPYLEPSESLLDELCMAALSGTDVRIIMPDKPDHPFVYWANRHYAAVLMLAGVKVYEYNRGFVHAK
jgi:cardiolipin synthase A/B